MITFYDIAFSLTYLWLVIILLLGVAALTFNLVGWIVSARDEVRYNRAHGRTRAAWKQREEARRDRAHQ